MLISFSFALIGQISNNVSNFIGAETTKRKVCSSNVGSRLWGGALPDDTKNGREEDYILGSVVDLPNVLKSGMA